MTEPDAAEQAPPVCYRHPDRETWVRCTRCERPVCPDCMRSASVGFQCPECVADGARTTREARTVFGGRISGDTSRVSIALVALNVLVFVVGLAVGERSLQEAYGNVPGPVLFQDGTVGGVADGDYYRLLTAAFLHAGVFHLMMNMFALAMLGPMLEAELGRGRAGLRPPRSTAHPAAGRRVRGRARGAGRDRGRPQVDARRLTYTRL